MTFCKDKGSDWDHVDAEFKKQYPPLKNTRLVSLSKPASIKKILMEVRKFNPHWQMGSPNTLASPAPSFISQVSPNLKLHMTKTSLPIAGSSKRYPVLLENNIESDKNMTEFVTAPSATQRLPTVSKFLADLEHDLSDAYELLRSEGFGTRDRLFVFAKWNEKDLHALFKEALPRLTVPQRFILVKGLKKYDGREGKWSKVNGIK
ncbi:hypothetical protein H0H81_007585 [Sphagnurus paluster]|uniref:Uncharacterized protein n=1 Tax=Sphagnurus paluster TaxID=117069 RepID=A0A9P7FWW5_9AGAR|nr:hypothetical protein H0H81_007585 [Sphagnurus paluster]